MPNWNGIEDVSSVPYNVWLCRVKETDGWKPLRKADCWALNESKEPSVYIEGGRCTADKENGVIRHNFHRSPERQLQSAFWFVRKDPEKKILEPISNKSDAEKIETLYQLAVQSSTSLGPGIDSVLKEEVELEDKSIVQVVKTGGGNVLCLKKRTPGWLSKSEELQRGYGNYTVEGEDNEMMLGEISDLYFVVHGVGESIWSREDSGMASLIDEVNRMRVTIQKKQIDEWRKQCEKAKKSAVMPPPMPGRIELIPIEWYERLHGSSSSLSKTLRSVTLPTIPALRGIANEAVFDVMLYITPTFCDPILECVTSQIIASYDRFLNVHPKFESNGGKVSLIGHSLGSVILWDLLSILKDFTEPVPKQNFGGGLGKRDSSGGVQIASPDNKANIGFQAYSEENADTASNGTWGPTLPKRPEQILPFTPENIIFLGSPIGLFLTLRGAHPVFDEFRKKRVDEILKEFHATKAAMESKEEKSNPSDDNTKEGSELPELPFASPFTLPVNGGIYNVFNPSDPVAYRIEPLLLPPDINPEDIPAPIHLTVPGEGVRLHIKAQQIGDEIAKAIEGKKSTFTSFLTTAVAALGKSEKDLVPRGDLEHSTGPQIFPLGGKAERVDYQLQRGVVDNEYVSSVTAHSTYFVNTDVIDFVINLASKTPSTEIKTTPDTI